MAADNNQSLDLVGQVLGGRYQIDRLLGVGGMGAVYEATHVHIDRRLALKVLLKRHSQDPELVERLHREALLTSRIGSPHIVSISDVGITEGGMRYVAMELLIGRDLRSALEGDQRMPVPDILAIMFQVLAGVGAAHRLGVVHRDLKPDNIFLVEQVDVEPMVKVLDFGISKQITAENYQPRLTATGVIIGTPLYMAPEQLLAQAVDARTDIYSLGVVLFQMLTGRTPYTGGSYVELATRHLVDPVPDVTLLRPETPPFLAAVVTRALRKLPEERFSSTEEFAAALYEGMTESQRARAVAPVDISSQRKSPRRVTAVVWSAIVLGSVALAIAVGVGLRTNDAAVAEPSVPPTSSEVRFESLPTASLPDGGQPIDARPLDASTPVLDAPKAIPITKPKRDKKPTSNSPIQNPEVGTVPPNVVVPEKPTSPKLPEGAKPNPYDP